MQTIYTRYSHPVHIERDDSYIHITAEGEKTHDIKVKKFAEAAGLVDRKLYDAVVTDARRSREDQLKAEKSLGQVEKLLEHLRSEAKELGERDSEISDVIVQIAHDLERALSGEPAFDLPTEMPAKIEATHRFEDYTTKLRLLTDGQTRFWQAESNGETYWPEAVMEIFYDHKLVEPRE